MDLSCHQFEHRGLAVLSVAGEIDLATVPRLREHLVRLVGDHAGETVLVDLSGVTFCDSLGLGLLVGAQRRARAHAGELRIVVPDGRVTETFALAGLDGVLPLFADIETAAG